MRITLASGRRGPDLRLDRQQRRARWRAHRRAALDHEWLTTRQDARRSDGPLARHAGAVPTRRDERAARDGVGGGDRRHGLATDRDARVGRGGCGLPTVRAEDRGADVEDGPRHRYTTVKAPLFTLTVGPVSMMDAPCEFWM